MGRHVRDHVGQEHKDSAGKCLFPPAGSQDTSHRAEELTWLGQPHPAHLCLMAIMKHQACRRAGRTRPTEMRSTNQSSKLTQNKDAKKDVIIVFHMLKKVSRNMEDTLKTEIKLLKITTQCEIKNTHWMALMAD